MKLAVEFPSIAFRDGPQGVVDLARSIEAIGFDQIDMYDHVVMGHPAGDRTVGPYPPSMPILEALMTLAFMASVTKRVGLGTEVLILPQRQPTLVAKQVSTLDTLSGGRVRLGVGVGWLEAEYEALGVDFRQRGAMADEAIVLLRSYWSEASVSHEGAHYRAVAMAMEPKPPQRDGIPVWVGGRSAAALRRAGRLGDGWMASAVLSDLEKARGDIATVRRHAEEAGRDPSGLGFQAQLSGPPRQGDVGIREFYAEPTRVAETALSLAEVGFGWATVNVTGVFLAGARSTAAMAEALAPIHDAVRAEVGYD